MRLPLLSAAILLLACGAEPAPPASDLAPDPAPDPAPEARPEEVRGTPDPPPPAGRTRVVLLGSGTPEPDPERSGPCVAVVVDEAVYLFDAGPGVVRRAAAADLDGAALTRVFLTHLHSDHTVGLPDLVLSPWVTGRRDPLLVLGPPGTEAMVGHVLAAWEQDRHVRTAGLEANAPLVVEPSDVTPGEVYRDARVVVRAFRVPHGSWEHAYGYRVETVDRVVVLSGDTAPDDAVVEACDGCDLLLHEVYAASRYDRLPEAARAYHGAFHTSSRELGRLAARARPRRLVLYHHLLWGASSAELVGEVRAAFGGEVLFGRDLGVY